MIRQPDALGNRVLDYSGVGYKGGVVPIPVVAVKTNLVPVSGNNGPRIQAAINYVSSLPLDSSGFRGAVFLAAGTYLISNSITISASGVVLRGAGDDSNGTILRAAGPRSSADISGDHAPLIIISGSGSGSTSGSTRNITNNYVPVGAISFNVDSTSGLTVGGRVLVTRPSPANWIHDIGMDLVSPAWTAGSFDVPSERLITRIEGSRITLDSPLTCALEAQYGGGTIKNYSWSGRINNVGIEDIRGISDFDPSVTTNTGASSYYYSDELHALDFIQAGAVENAWVRRVTSESFGYACVHLTGGSRAVTVSDCQSLDPVSEITGSRRYAFSLSDARDCLVQNCYTRNDRHQFVTDSLNTGPNVFVDGQSDSAYADAGPHFRWGTGAIWDSVTVNGNQINVRNRGNAGTSHGWAGANEVVWNSKAASFIVESPATARNWLIGCIGSLGVNSLAVGPHPAGTYDSRNTNVFPNSLYYAQLQDRMAAPNLQTREYWLGSIDQFIGGGATGEFVTVDSAWRNAVLAAAGAAHVSNFNLVTNDQWVPFTFNFSLSSTDQIVGATLAMAMRSYTGTSTNLSLYLNAIANSNDFSTLGWLPIGSGTNTTARVVDLGNQLELLTNGTLNVAVAGDVGIDWAQLELKVAPVRTLYTNTILAVADAYVNGGASATNNYGAASTLQIKNSTSPDGQRQAYLRWNIAGCSAGLQQARIRLTPVAVGTNGYENGLTLAAGNNWSEAALTWDNQPGGGKRFATWVPAADVPVEMVVTPQVLTALAADGQLSVELFALNNNGGSGVASYASREHVNAAIRPQLLLIYSNAVPGISLIGDQAIPANSSTGPIPFTIGDSVSSPNLLTLGAISSNPALVPLTNIAFGGALSNRTVTVTPLAGQIGSAQVTIVVTNPAGLTAGSQFTVTVTNEVVTSASGSWIADASGNWNDAVNWNGGMIASGTNMTATFAVHASDTRFVNNDSSRTLGNLIFRDTNPNPGGGWFITNHPITLQVASSTPSISVSNVDATISSVLDGAQGLTLTGGGTLTLDGANLYSGTTSISAGALLAANNLALGSGSDMTSIGNAANAALALGRNITLAEPLTIACKASALGNVPAVVNVSGTNTLAGPIALTTGGTYWTFQAAGGKLNVTGAVTNITTSNVRTIWLRGATEGEWSSAIGNSAAALGTALRKDDSGKWTLSGNNSYTGNTVISNGTLLVDGVIATGGAVQAFGGSLGGSGIILAPVTISSGAALVPGGNLSPLTINNDLTLNDGSVSALAINAQTLTSDSVQGISNIVYAGTLSLTNVAGTLAAGQSFHLFSAATFSGNFSSISPSSPGAELAWDFNPANGTLTVLSTTVTPPEFTGIMPDASGGFTLLGTGPANADYRIFATTNLSLAFSNWTATTTGNFSGGVFNFTDLEATNHPQRFYRIVTP